MFWNKSKIAEPVFVKLDLNKLDASDEVKIIFFLLIKQVGRYSDSKNTNMELFVTEQALTDFPALKKLIKDY